MVRNSAPVFYRKFCRSNVQAPVDLDGIAIYDFAMKCFGQRKAKLAFPGACGAQHDNQL